jgi:hypothetical protein
MSSNFFELVQRNALDDDAGITRTGQVLLQAPGEEMAGDDVDENASGSCGN